MSVRALLVVVAAAAGGATASRALAPIGRSALVEGGAPIEIVADVDLPRAKDVLAIARSTWKEASELFGGSDADAEPPKLHLYGSVPAYEAACDRLAGGSFKRNLAFAEWTSVTAHVVLQPPLAAEALERLAPTFQTLRLVAHETTHLVRYSKLPNHRSHPQWYADGLASWIEMRALARGGWMETPEQTPTYSTDVLRVQRMLKLDRLPSVEEFIHDRTDSLEFFDRYAARWLLVRFLAEGAHAKAFQSFHGDLRQIGGGDGFVERSAAALEKRLGAKGFGAVDAAFRKWIPTLKPQWDETLRSLETAGDEWTQTAFERNAVAFRTEQAGRKPYAIEGEVTALRDRSKAPQMNLLLGRTVLSNGAERFVSVAFVPGSGVTVLEYDGGAPEADAWKNVVFAKAPETAVGRPLPFRVECATKSDETVVTVKIAGDVVAQATIGRSLEGPWGLGAQGGTSGIWKSVRRVDLGSR